MSRVVAIIRGDFVYAGEIACRRAEISVSIKKKGREKGACWVDREKKVVHVETRRESCDLRSRRKPRVLHIRRMMSFVSSFHRPATLNSLYLEFQEERPSYGDDINTKEIHHVAREKRAISRAIPLWRVCSASTLPAKISLEFL